MESSHSWSRRDLLLSGAAAGAAVALDGSPAKADKPRLPKIITDCQGHVWKPGGPKPGPDQRQTPMLFEESLKVITTAGVRRLVIVAPAWGPGGNEYPLLAAKTYPQHFHVMGYFNVAKPPTPQELTDWKKQPGMLGVRISLATPASRKWFTDGSADWVWQIMEREQIPLMLYCYPALAELDRIATKYPGLKIAMDAFEVTRDKKGAAAFSDYKNILALARHSNIGIKCESVPVMSAEGYPYNDLLPFFKPTYDSFGPERMFWGADMTQFKEPLVASYMNCVRFMTEIDWMTDRDLELIMGESIGKWLNWPQPA